jgi:hypothetical protein
MAWLIYGTPLKPRYTHHFEWSGVTEEQRKALEVGKQIEPPASGIVGRKLSNAGKLHPLPDLFKGCNAWIVCEEFKKIIDALEPDKNQFLPVRLLDEIEKEVQRRYYLMNVTEMNETLDLQKSYVHSNWIEAKTQSGEMKRVQSWHLDPMPAPLFADKSQVAGKHLWRGSKSFVRYMFFSDALMKCVKKARLKELRAYPVTEE